MRGLPRSSSHTLLASLTQIGLLQCRARGRYRIGWRVVELGEALRGTIDVRSCAAPILDRLVERYGETAHLAVMDRWRVLYVDKVVGTHNLSVHGARVGTRPDAHCTAVGKVLLARCGEIELRRYLAGRGLKRYTGATITSPAELLAALERVRSAGFALDLGEAVSDVRCVAAPVRDDLGTVVAALSMSVPVSRFGPAQSEYAGVVVAAAHEVSRAIAESAGPVDGATVAWRRAS
ncbi:IclR family transcriptional regulator [Amycolatopsis alkalitolerans]|uniref:IclR family transcriptional regulator n=1 Tax=Amycolatopsis alkalitolerans TaxID=2547244 RepID=UPI001F44EBC0|nr:IclR family transcriptional regulator [Amycolatopsis alkalitolerans]